MDLATVVRARHLELERGRGMNEKRRGESWQRGEEGKEGEEVEINKDTRVLPQFM